VTKRVKDEATGAAHKTAKNAAWSGSSRPPMERLNIYSSDLMPFP
jgi:hypothetical protein